MLEDECHKALGVYSLLFQFVLHSPHCHLEEEADEVFVGCFCSNHTKGGDVFLACFGRDDKKRVA